MAVFFISRKNGTKLPIGTLNIESIPPAANMFTIKTWLAALATTFQLLCVFSPAQANPQHIQLGIAAQPKSVLAEDGTTTTLAILLKGPVKSIQWRKNGMPIEAANKTHLEIVASQSKSAPDSYDVLVNDAFGNTLVSDTATIGIAQADSQGLTRQGRTLESLKLQSLFNLIQVFDHVAARVLEPLEYRKVNHTVSTRYPACPDQSNVETIEPAQVQYTTHQILMLELDLCFVPKASRLGEESGALISGKYRRSNTSILLANKEIQVTEQSAENLLLRFPFAKDWGNSNTVDFDISITGGLILQTEINKPSANTATVRKESVWKRGSTIKNPQTGVTAEFVSGKYIQETFGVYQRNEFVPNRETEFFDNLTLKIGSETVVISGGVTKIYDRSDIHRQGQYSISVNGKQVMKTHSTVTVPPQQAGALPHVPKLNGFFLNDHPTDKPGEPIRMVSPGRESPIKIN